MNDRQIQAERLAKMLRLDADDTAEYVELYLGGATHAEALLAVWATPRVDRSITCGSGYFSDPEDIQDFSDEEIADFREEWADRAERVVREGGLLISRHGKRGIEISDTADIVAAMRETQLSFEQPEEPSNVLVTLHDDDDEQTPEVITLDRVAIEMSQDEVIEAREAGDWERYRDLRHHGMSHRLAIMLLSKQGPTGIVRGSENPCPNKG